MSERMSLLEFLKERSGIRLSKLEAYLDLVDKASVQYIPKDLCKQEFSLSNGQFVITITELAGCWHWHRATVRTFIEQLEKMNQISVTRLTKSQIITIPMLAETPALFGYILLGEDNGQLLGTVIAVVEEEDVYRIGRMAKRQDVRIGLRLGM